MSFSHAVVISVPNTLKFANKKSALDVDALRKQSEGLVETLREAGVAVNEYRLADDSCVSKLLVGDAAVAINGTVILCRPKKPGISTPSCDAFCRHAVILYRSVQRPLTARLLFSKEEMFFHWQRDICWYTEAWNKLRRC